MDVKIVNVSFEGIQDYLNHACEDIKSALVGMENNHILTDGDNATLLYVIAEVQKISERIAEVTEPIKEVGL